MSVAMGVMSGLFVYNGEIQQVAKMHGGVDEKENITKQHP